MRNPVVTRVRPYQVWDLGGETLQSRAEALLELGGTIWGKRPDKQRRLEIECERYMGTGLLFSRAHS